MSNYIDEDTETIRTMLRNNLADILEEEKYRPEPDNKTVTLFDTWVWGTNET